MMYFLLSILLLLSLFVLLLFYAVVSVKLQYHANTNELAAVVSWLNSLITAKVNIKSNNSSVSVYFSRIRIFSKVIKGTRGKRIINWKYIKAFDLNDTFADVHYGLDNPFSTGIISGIVRMIQSYFSVIRISQFPDFLPDQEYLYVHAGTELNIGKTLANMVRIKLDNKKKRRDFAWSSR